MTNPTELIQLYILLSYEKLQRSTISQRQRPTEASLRNRLLVWRFLKKIENEPVTCDQELFTNNQTNNINDDLDNNNPWIIDFNTNCDDDNSIDMDIESDIVTVLGSNNEINNNSTCETMTIDQTSDVTVLLKRAIGAERRQKSSKDNFHFNENDNNNTNLHHVSETNTFEETEQFFHDLCNELTNTTASLVSTSTTNALNFSTSPEQTLIH
ncbi:unnamed protein product [Rotaria magnacalcarata]|uniref:Uncharacterized protein n=1 Tax=Rotaria magnacalcarata TaxID=392030 RepID=A0A815KB99_9BILA|nr:unnamed protein product [Rotaria magnacalcarata]CAF1535637.1 unnamed protein product [Rotaria magnacalcarata]CAF2024696.1 unnamed protein product [Rotaria magnacalcarata]CAF2043126.1 unnamed protein product [Rotaria magnacalcarata]CAF2156785.1 unnamed protein product [Rotaria magnacalcarata]